MLIVSRFYIELTFDDKNNVNTFLEIVVSIDEDDNTLNNLYHHQILSNNEYF
jgi:hypothetical protein